MPADQIESLQAKLTRLRERERAIVAQASKLQREMAEMDRKRETQYLCTLGRAWIALGERSPEGTRATMQRFLDSYISRDADKEILSSTPWAVNVPAAQSEPSYASEASHDYDDSEQA